METETDPKKKEELQQEITLPTTLTIPYLNKEQIHQLEEWTELHCNEIIFDSTVDNWKQHTSVLNEKIFGKKQIALVIEDTNGNIFGCFVNPLSGIVFIQEGIMSSFKVVHEENRVKGISFTVSATRIEIILYGNAVAFGRLSNISALFSTLLSFTAVLRFS